MRESLLKESTDPNRYTAKAKFCFCKNNKRRIITAGREGARRSEKAKVPEDGGLINQALIDLKPVNACVHTYTKPQTSITRSRGLGCRIHESVEDTKLSTNKQHTL
jgi:hypothetical protein